MPKHGCFYILAKAVLFCFNANSQPADGDSIFHYNALNNVKTAYFATVKERAGLYNGIAYDAYGHGNNGTPFFIADSMFNGSVFCDGLLYENVPLKYDLVYDGLVTEYYYNNKLIQLIKDKVSYFSMAGHQFVKVDKSAETLGGPSGYCDVPYSDKKTLVLVKRTKKLQQSTNADDKSSVFVQFNQYYIYKDDKYYTVNSETELLKIFKDKAQEVKKYMRSKRVKYKKNAEQAIITATLFYNGLTK